jgi:hypothetical protein
LLAVVKADLPVRTCSICPRIEPARLQNSNDEGRKTAPSLSVAPDDATGVDHLFAARQSRRRTSYAEFSQLDFAIDPSTGTLDEKGNVTCWAV